jgi:hypothetical protein
LTLEPQATSAVALQWAIFSEDPTSRFRADLRFLEAHRQKTEDTKILTPHYLVACWNRLFRTITGDRLYLLTSAGETAFTTEVPAAGSARGGEREPVGRKWLTTKAVHTGADGFCWCIPFDATTEQVLDVRLDLKNRTRLADLAEKHEGA